MNFQRTGGAETSRIIRVTLPLCRNARLVRVKAFCFSQIILFALALFSPGKIDGADAYTWEYEKSPPEPSYLVRRALQDKMREQQDKFLIRVPIHDAVRPQQDLVHDTASPIRALPPAEDPNQGLWLLAFFLVAGFLVLRKLAPYLLTELNQHFNPWAVVPAGAADVSSNIRDEAQAVAEYVAGFKVGGVAATGADGKTTRVVAEFLLSAPLQIKGLEELLGT